MNLKTKLQYGCYIATMLILSSCGGSADSDMDSGAPGTTKVDKKDTDAKAKKVFSTIPDPVEATKLLKAAGASYNKELLSPIENVSKCSTVKDRALNLGIYGSDLSFTSVFDQTQESMLYLKCTNSLAADLKISGAFDQKMTDRIEANMDNRDSLLAIISESYWKSDSYLSANGQAGVSALMVAGGWVEGLYIATQIATKTKNEAIITKIGEQKTSLNNLIDFLEAYKTASGEQEVLTAVNEIKTIYNGIDGKVSPEQLKQLTEKTAQIRNKMIKGS